MEGQVCSFNWEPFKALYKSSLPKTTPRRFWFNLNNSPNTPSCQRGQHNLGLKQRQFWMSTKLIWRVYLCTASKVIRIVCYCTPPALALYPIAFVHEILKFVVWLMTTCQKWVLTRPILGRNVYYNYSLHVPLKWVTTTCNHQQNIFVKTLVWKRNCGWKACNESMHIL